MEEAVAVAVAPLGQRLTESVGNEVDCYYKSVAFHDNVDDDNAFVLFPRPPTVFLEFLEQLLTCRQNLGSSRH